MFIGVATTPVAWLAFALEYTRRKAWLNTRRLILLCIIPAITLTLILTSNFHQLFWIKVAVSSDGGFLHLDEYQRSVVLVGTYDLFIYPDRDWLDPDRAGTVALAHTIPRANVLGPARYPDTICRQYSLQFPYHPHPDRPDTVCPDSYKHGSGIRDCSVTVCWILRPLRVTLSWME